jgi:DNA-binding NarL/FixJ family response regulator
MSAPDVVRVLIADDHLIFRDGLRALLASAPDTELVGEAATGEEAIALASSLQPDLILMDLQMPGVSGVEATRRIMQDSPHTRVLVITMFEDDNSVLSAMRAGARGYVLKGATHAEMVRAIRAVAEGEALFGPTIAARLTDFFANATPMLVPRMFPELSDREREILGLIAQGQKNPDIAARLILSPKTVRNHVTNILSKLQVADRGEAIIRAREAGLGLDSRGHA